MYRVLEEIEPLCPSGSPRYLMGVGSPEDLFECVARGVDLFDCVLPTRIARNGALFTRGGRLNLRNAQYAADSRPVEEGCRCYTCRNFSRAYLRHLMVCGEVLGLHLATVHNLTFILDLMHSIRTSIAEGVFSTFMEEFLVGYRVADPGARERNRAARSRSRPATVS
jgi:queuine tRNA-ribosyltransferase